MQTAAGGDLTPPARMVKTFCTRPAQRQDGCIFFLPFDNMQLIEPCCTQKHWPALRRSLGENGTRLFCGFGDLSIDELMSVILNRYSETDMMIVPTWARRHRPRLRNGSPKTPIRTGSSPTTSSNATPPSCCPTLPSTATSTLPTAHASPPSPPRICRSSASCVGIIRE